MAKKKKQKLYKEQYCKKHNQYYADYMSDCPICIGERMGTKKPKMIKLEK